MKKPEAYITVSRNQMKNTSPQGGEVFLRDGQEFEICLFNPTQDLVAASILINGKAISNRRVLLKPAERVYLERYIDTPNKFKFETYVVDAGDKQVDSAIANNGMVEVRFFREKQKPQITTYTYNSDWLSPQTWTYYSNANLGDVSNYNVANSVSYSSTSSGSFDFMNQELSRGETGDKIEQIKRGVLKKDKRALSNAPVKKTPGFSDIESMFDGDFQDKSTKETGRVEMGSNSSQSFSETTKYDFEYTHSHAVWYKLMPVSEKPVEVDEFRKYCTSCGTRAKKSSWAFCPNCGGKF